MISTTPEVGRTVTVRPTEPTNAIDRDELLAGLGNALASFPTPEINELYDLGDPDPREAGAPAESWEPLFAAEIEREVFDAAIEEVIDEVGRLLTEAVNRRLPWSTTHTGWRVHR